MPHGGLAAMEAALAEALAKAGGAKGGKPGRVIVVAEALRQRTGRIADLRRLVELKERYGALQALDEPLSSGTLC